MYKIVIDATDRFNKSVSLLKDDQLIDAKAGDIDIVSVIKDLLEEHRLVLGDIECLEANAGPGSFTGIKVGVTIANVLNWALEKNCPVIEPEYGRAPNISERKKR